jgi:CPA2 family monovalent cation:H+ antiporter-2
MRSVIEQGQMDSPQGKMMLGVLIFQDLCVVPLMLLVPMLSGEAVALVDVLYLMAKAAFIVIAVVLSARYVVPGLLHQVVQTRSRELFLISVVLICLGTALFTSRYGLSLALGAFLAGLVISESEYAYQALAEVLPFKDSFLGLFFVSIGMLLDVRYVMGNPFWVAGSVALIFGIKVVATTAVLLLVTRAPRASLFAALGLAQIGEFSFILAGAGKASGLMSPDAFQLFLSASIATMMLTPFIIKAAPTLSSRFMLFSPREDMPVGSPDNPLEDAAPYSPVNHVIIIGFGVNGRNVASSLKSIGVPYVILDLNTVTVRQERTRGEPIYFGDATSTEVLERLGIGHASTLVIAISDPTATRKITATARRMNNQVRIIVRTRYVSEVDELVTLGADEVIPEEFETSVEIFSRVLAHLNVPRNVIDEHIEEIRKHRYLALRTPDVPHKTVADRADLLGAVNTLTYLVREGSPLVGQSLMATGLRGRTGATVIAIQRPAGIEANPEPASVIGEGDVLMIMGSRHQLVRAVEHLDTFAP